MKKILLGSLLFAIALLCAQAPRPYKLIHADKLIMRTVQDEHISDLVGNVHFFYGETEFFSDFATVYEKQEIANLQGNVHVHEDTLHLYADKAEYYKQADQLFLTGSVLAEEIHADSTRRTFRSNRAEYMRDVREFHAIDSVFAWDERENMTGTCGYLTYNIDQGYGYLMRNPELSISDADTLTISAQKIEYFDASRKIVATFDVDVQSTDNRVTSDFLIYFDTEEKAIFKGQPRFYSEFGDGLAQEFHIFFHNQEIHQAVFIDSCRVDFRSQDDSAKRNWIVANRMRFEFEDGVIRRGYAEGSVETLVLQEQTDKKDYSANRSEGEELHIQFNDKQDISQISLKTRITGKYRFNND
jgi:lipopolysaccharide export system protein LptA